MNTSNSGNPEGTGDKRQPETSQVPQHSLTTIQNVHRIQTIQNIVQSNVQTIQPAQSVVSTVASAIVGKSISLDLNPKLSLMKSVVQSGSAVSDANKITTTLCSVGSTVRIISPGMLSTVERQNASPGQSQGVQGVQGVQQVVTTIPATYHVPRGPAAVANISAPRSTVATPIVRASGAAVVPIARPGAPTTVTTTQWPPKTSVVYAPPQRHPVPPVTRVTTRPQAVYTAQQSQLAPQSQIRPVQATVVTATVSGGVSGAPRLLTPVLQSTNTLTRIPVPQVRPTVPLVSTGVQPPRHPSQGIQSTTHQPTRTLAVPATTNRVTVTAPVVGTANRIPGTASLAVQPALGRQLSINPTPGATNFSRVVIPSQQIQQAPGHQQGPRVVQTITSLANIGTVSRVIATTTSGGISNMARVSQSAPTSVARITGMTLHSLPLTSPRTTPAPMKPLQAQTITQTVQIKSSGQQTLRVTPATPVVMTTTASTIVTSAPPATIIINNTNSIPSSPNQYQYRQGQPVRLLVEPSHEDNHSKPNASPRPSILRKRDHDSSPAKSIAKNLVPVLTSLAARQSMGSPPGSPRADREGNHSSGSTTVSATSSPGLDEEPEQSRINPQGNSMEMSPRKKPRKQQLTGVELTEARCNVEEMQFICEDKIKREIKEERRDKFEREGQTVLVRGRPTPSLIDSSWKNRWGGRLHHYRRPGDVRPKEERRPTVAEIAQQKFVLQKINGWKVYQLTAQMEDLAQLEKQVHEKLKSTLLMLESQQPTKNRQDDGIERANELIKGNMQRSSLISEGMSEARTQLIAIFQHKDHVSDILQRCGNKRSQKKRDK
ncbi:histone deacetylase complex subunit SAP130-A isoform X2 [Fopius arisanus]|uniref:Histone deacetylase complex subunit SAP130-A isoform X2 n=1 Tax=Fopius arisanus TaxID=64838 RepID=A0A0C9R3M6_9HYME|nr:PREDICTED: histone deacetylase complex subunit SAP130-A isoform X2 [Fopius arisanus]